MPLRYGLVENKLTADPDDYMAVVQDNETFTEEQIVERMISRGSTVTKAEALGVIEEFGLALEDIIKGGNYVKTNLFSIFPSIAGIFNSSGDGFDSHRHGIRLNISAGSRLNRVVQDIKVEKVKVSIPAPVIEKFTNLKTKTVNESFSPGQIAMLTGLLMKFDESDPEQGIFFISNEGAETRVTNVSKNKPSELLFFVPETLTAGTYEIEVRAKLQNRKNISKGKLLHNLVPVN